MGKKRGNFLKLCRCAQCKARRHAFRAEIRRMNKRVRSWGKGGNKEPEFGLYTD